MRASLLLISTIAIALITACDSGSESKTSTTVNEPGSGGGGSGGGGGSIDWDSALDDLALRGGGMKGDPLASGDAFWTRAVDFASGTPLAGVGVSVADESGVFLESALTDAEGNASFSALTATPAYVSFVQPQTSEVITFAGNAIAPLRQFICGSFEQADPQARDLDVTITNLSAGDDLVVRINGVEVHSADTCAATETFTVDASAFGAGQLDAGSAWVMIAEVYDNSSAAVDREDLLSASYVLDSDGTPAIPGAAVALSLNHASGVGPAREGMSAGLCSVASVSGNVLRPLTLTTVLALPRITLGITNAYGTWSFDQLTFDINNPLGLLATSFPYSFDYPELPRSVAGGSWGSSSRQAQAFIADAATLQGLFQGGGLPSNFDPATLANIAIMVKQVDQAGVSEADVNMQGLAAVRPATVFTDFTLDSFMGATGQNVTAILVGELASDSWFVSLASGMDGALNFPVVAASIGSLPVSDVWLALSNASVGGQGDPSAMLRAPWASNLNLASNGDSGSDTMRLSVASRISQSGSLALGVRSPTNASAFTVASDTIEFDAMGLEARDGVYQVDLTIDPTGRSRIWRFILPSEASLSAGSGTYSLRIPALGSGAPFDAAQIESSIASLVIAPSFISLGDVSATSANFGLRELQLNFELSAELLSRNILSLFAATPKLWTVTLPGATVDPQ